MMLTSTSLLIDATHQVVFALCERHCAARLLPAAAVECNHALHLVVRPGCRTDLCGSRKRGSG